MLCCAGLTHRQQSIRLFWDWQERCIPGVSRLKRMFLKGLRCGAGIAGASTRLLSARSRESRSQQGRQQAGPRGRPEHAQAASQAEAQPAGAQPSGPAAPNRASLLAPEQATAAGPASQAAQVGDSKTISLCGGWRIWLGSHRHHSDQGLTAYIFTRVSNLGDSSDHARCS